MIRSRWRLWALGVALAAVIFIWLVVFAESREGQLTVAFLDIGQGDAIYIEAPNGNQMLIDGGRGSAVVAALGGVMPFYDRSLDLVIATHPDADHIGGLPDVFDRFEVAGYLESGAEADTDTFAALKRRVASESAAVLETVAGTLVDLGGGVRFEIVWPPAGFTSGDTNEYSIVGRLVYGASEVMLTGDAPIKIEQAIIAAGWPLQSDILKVGHHGSKTSSGDAFVAAVKPDYAIISVGKDNRYGHPAPDALSRLQQSGAAVWRTDELGTIIFQTDGRRWQTK